jgi:Protein of unknown function (DUF2752)
MLPSVEKMSSGEQPWLTLIPWQRSGLIVSACVVATALGLAAWLTPNTQGLGTHQQLGLPPCTMRLWAGMRCPSCGMTTSWAHLMHGDVMQAFRTNIGGALLALAALAYVPWGLVSGVRGRWWLVTPNEWIVAAASIAVLIVTVTEWGVRVCWEWNS